MKTPSRMSGNSTPPRGITTTTPGAPARPSALTIPAYTPSMANLNSPPRIVRQLNFVGDPMNENTGDPLPANRPRPNKNNKPNDPTALKGGKRRRYTKKSKKTKKSRRASMKRK